MDPNKENNKSWKKVGIESTYEAAAARKEKLLSENSDNKLLVKIRRCGAGGTQFKLKVWHPDFVKPKNNKKGSK
tara:strand:- start:256 stop:477 length:222 start_codon:yes stop_codon:yes gene_type:complete